MKTLVDTNVIVRFLVADNSTQYKQVVAWFKKAEKSKQSLTINVLIVAEACFVLESVYQLDHDRIATAMEVFLSQRWFDVEDRDILLNIWPSYRQGQHFVDCYIFAWQQTKKSQVLSFDKKLLNKLK